MELYQLKSFVKVAELGNLTRASEALYTSQPAISAQIKTLEEFLGVQLFVRSAKGMKLTEAGNRLYDDACTTLAAADKLHQRALLLRDEIVGELKIGIHTDFDFVKTGALYTAMKERCPQLNLHFYQTSSASIIRPLRTGEFDAGFTFGPKRNAELSVEVLSHIPLRVVIPTAFSADYVKADTAALSDLPWVYTSNTCPFYSVCEELFGNESKHPDQLAWVDTEEAMVSLVKAGVGLSILRQDMAQTLQDGGFANIWEGEVPEIEFNFVTTQRRQHDPIITLFRECIYDCWGIEAPEAITTKSA